jgi:hypothetical protein
VRAAIDHRYAQPCLRGDGDEIVGDPRGIEIVAHELPAASADETGDDRALAERAQHTDDIDRLP